MFNTNMSGKRAVEYNRLTNNSASLLISDDSYQTVKVGNQHYLAKRVLGQIVSKNTGSILEEKYIACLIGKIIDGKVTPLDSGDPAKKSYFVNIFIFNIGAENEDILKELQEKGYDVSLIPVVPSTYYIPDIEE